MRLRVIVLVVLLAFGGAITLDRMSPAAAPARSTITFDPRGGVLTCPYLTEPDAIAGVEIANLGTDASSVRVSFSRPKGAPVVVPVALAPSSVKGVPIPRTVKGPSGAVIEYSGGTVVASHVMRLPQTRGPIPRGAGLAVAPCQGTGEGDIVVAGASTLNSDSTLALFNPGGADADVSISLLADGRVIKPVRLDRRLVASHARLDFKIGDFAFNARAVTAVIKANAGRVAAEVLLRTRGGPELLPAQAPSIESIAVSGRSGAIAESTTTVVGSDDAGLDVRAIDMAHQQSAKGFPPSLPPAATKVIGIADVGGGKPVALAMFVSVGSPVVASTRWTVRGPGGQAEIASAPAGAVTERWGAVVGGMGQFGVERFIVVNPGTAAVRARVVTITGKGPVARSITIPPGRLGQFALGTGSGPIGLLVAADAPVTVAVLCTAIAGTTSTSAGAMLATALLPARAVGVAIDQRSGLPATLPDR